MEIKRGNVMDNPIDASVGLAFSLKIFAAYQQYGLLHTTVHHVLGISGPCKICLELKQGHVVSCFLEDHRGRRSPAMKEVLLRLDREKGPFEWQFSPLLVPLTPSPQVQRGGTGQRRNETVPRRLQQRLDPRILCQLSPWQQILLSSVFSLVDGQHTLEEIAARTQLPLYKVEEALRILISLNAIAL
jgi:hypothetical protein